MPDDDLTPPARQCGHSREYILSRLEREGHTDWIAAIEGGRLSAYAAAVELGWVKMPPTLSGPRSNQAKRRHHQLFQERLRMADGRLQLDPGKLTAEPENFLRYGPRDCFDNAFADESAVLAAWEQHRERILSSYQSGRRPWAWRAIDRPELPWRGYTHERSGLWRADVLSPEERIAL